MSEVQRTYARKSLDLDIDASYRILSDSASVKINKLMDVSYGGLGVMVPKKLDNDLDISVTILIDEYKLRFIAQVKRCIEIPGGFELGLQFQTISKKNLKRLYQMIK